MNNNRITVLILFILIVCFSISFAQEGQDVKCVKTSEIGSSIICLPEIIEMNECYELPNVKERMDKFEVGDNSILGVYLTDDIYSNIENFETIFIDEYFKIYLVNNTKDKTYGTSELEQIGDIMENNFIADNWDNLRKQVEEKNDELTIGVPVIIESYTPDENVKSFLMLTKISNIEAEKVMLMSMNILLIKEKIIWLGYYKLYVNEDSIQKIRSANDSVVMKLIEVNK
ncbi:MAG: hypothetical protein WAT71_17375 [Ignavibacteria bacterium]